MKILIVFHSLYSLAGGVDNRISQLEIELSKHVETSFLLFKENVDLPHKGKLNFIKSLSIPNIILKNKFKFKFISYVYGFINILIRIIKTRNFLKRNKIDTIFAVDDYFSIICILAAIGLNKKIVCSVRNNWNYLYNKNMTHLLPDFTYKYILPKLMNKYASSIHCVSKELEEILNNKYNIKNTKTIYNLFNLEKIKNKASKEINMSEDFFINIGHFNIQKNQQDTILTYKLLVEKYNVKEKLLLIGDGPLINKCKLLVEELNLQDRVLFIGKQKNPYKYLSKAKAYISTSLYEGLPAVFVESLILNIPIFSYNFKTGSKELCNNTTSTDPKSLAKRIYDILKSPTKVKISILEGKMIISKKFNKKKIIEEWLKIL